MVTYFRFKIYLFPFILIAQGTIRFTKTAPHCISSSSLADNPQYFYLAVLYVGKCHN